MTTGGDVPSDPLGLSPLAIAANLYASAEYLLVTDDGTLEERLFKSFAELARLATPYTPHLPTPIAAAMDELHGSLTGSYEPGGPQEIERLRQTLESMSVVERQRAAISVCTIGDFLQDALLDQRREQIGLLQAKPRPGPDLTGA